MKKNATKNQRINLRNQIFKQGINQQESNYELKDQPRNQTIQLVMTVGIKKSNQESKNQFRN